MIRLGECAMFDLWVNISRWYLYSYIQTGYVRFHA